MQHMIFVINTTEGSDGVPAAPDLADKKRRLISCAFVRFYLFINRSRCSGCKKDVWTVSWLQFHVLVSDYVKKTYCAWKTN